MEIPLLAILFILGASVGSFLNVVALRLPEGRSSLTGRSHCPHCKRGLRWHELVPLASFALLLGRCRRCKARLSLQYPAVEAATGALFALGGAVIPSPLAGGAGALLLYLIAASFFVLLFLCDIRTYTIPDRISIPAIGIIFLANSFVAGSPVSFFMAGAFGALWFLLQFFVSRGRWVGGGDIRLGALVGVLLGHPMVWLGLMLAYVGGSVIAVAAIAAGKKRFGDRLPFATMLLPAALVAFLWGEGIWSWYLNVLGF